MRFGSYSVLPGFGPTLGFSLLYLGVLVLLPLSALVLFAVNNLTLAEFWQVIGSPRVLASFRLSFGAALVAALLNALFGLILAWVLVRYTFPGRRLVDALIDLPFAMPTAVSGIALCAIFAPNGWIGQLLAPFGIQLAYNPIGVVIALTFIDADTQYLPDQLTLPLVWLGLIYNFNGSFVSLQQAVFGAIAGYMSLWLLNFAHKKLRGFDGMGGGDFKLLAALGAWLGASVLPIVVFAAALVGIVAALVMKAAKSQPIAFGPCLAIAGWLVFVANDKVKAGLNIWLNSAGLL